MQKAIQTSLQWTEDHGEEKSTLLPQDSPASHSATPEKERALRMTVSSGRKTLEYSAKFSQLSSWQRTFLDSLLLKTDWYSSVCALTWKLKGTKSHRLLFRLVPKTLATEEIGFGLLHTPAADDYKAATQIRPGRTANTEYLRRQIANLFPTPNSRDYKSPNRVESESPYTMLNETIHGLIPTPRTSDYKGASKQTELKGRNPMTNSLMDAVENGSNRGLKLQPAFAAWMMHLPEDYTLKPFLDQNGEPNP